WYAALNESFISAAVMMAVCGSALPMASACASSWFGATSAATDVCTSSPAIASSVSLLVTIPAAVMITALSQVDGISYVPTTVSGTTLPSIMTTSMVAPGSTAIPAGTYAPFSTLPHAAPSTTISQGSSRPCRYRATPTGSPSIRNVSTGVS